MQFEARGNAPIRIEDVPFPDRSTLVLEARRKDDYKKLALRWHPDKWSQRYGAQLCKADEANIMDRVKETFQTISSARER